MRAAPDVPADLALREVEPDRRALVALDAVTSRRRAWQCDNRRPASLTAREALESVQFEALLLWTAWANVLDGVELTDDDHERIAIAGQRIQAVYEAAR